MLSHFVCKKLTDTLALGVWYKILRKMDARHGIGGSMQGDEGAMHGDLDTKWYELTEEIISGMKKRRLRHPKVSFRIIEGALDDRLGQV